MAKSLWRIEGDRLHLSLHEGQAQAWRSDKRFVFMLAGTQGGKTSFGPWWLWREIQRRGAGDYIAATASYDLFKLKMLPEIRTVFEQVLGIARYWSGDKILELKDPEKGEFWATRADDPMWGRIILRSAASSGGLESATGQAAWLDECGQDGFSLEDWEAVLRRLSLSRGRVLGTTTLYNLGWIKNEIYDPWREGDPDIDVVQFASTVNPLFPQSEFDRAKTRMQGWRFQMFYLGKFAKPAGLIYSGFSDDQLVDPFPIPDDWKVVTGVDFGGANTATVWLAEDPYWGGWYAFRESLEGGMTTQQHVAKAKEHLRFDDYEFVGGAPSETQQRRDWRAAGLAVRQPPVSDVEAGIDRVTALIDELRVFRTLKGLRDELGSYRRKVDERGEPTEQIVDKRKYHRLDALRYAATIIIEHAPKPKATSHRGY